MNRSLTVLLVSLLTVFLLSGLSCNSDEPAAPDLQSEAAFHVVSTTPADGAIDVSRTADIVIRFSEPLSPATVTVHAIYFEPTIDFTLECQQGSDSIVIRPNDNFDYDRVYVVHVSGTIKSLKGESLSQDVTISLRTLVPSEFVAAVVPPDGVINAPNNAPIRVIFVLPMNPATVDSQSITISGMITSQVTYDSAMMTATAMPVVPLLSNHDYTAELTGGLATLGGTHLSEPYSWQFHTADEYFEVDLQYPAAGAVDVLPHDTIRLVFNASLDTATITVQSLFLTPATDYAYVYHDATRTLDILPLSGLEPGQGYTITLTNTVAAANGDRLPFISVYSFAVEERRALYVSPNGAGDGSESAPLGSIQAAVDSVVADPTLTSVCLDVGYYHELVYIDGPVEILGGLDRLGDWQASPIDSTVITGSVCHGNGVGAIVGSTAGPVLITSLTIVAPDGDSAGGGSFGLVCSEAAWVDLSDCNIVAGAGQAGADGTPGLDGIDGEDGYYCSAGQGIARGGAGGRGAPVGGSPEPGEQGYCGDGTQTGGTQGQAGEAGAPGENGSGGLRAVFWAEEGGVPIVRTFNGVPGTDGGDGCGGGGGGGADYWWEINHVTGEVSYYPGACGGGGGAGAAGGEGGGGGQAGGCSVGIALSDSHIGYADTRISTAGGGDGGQGGMPGLGAEGGTAGQPDQIGVSFGGTGGDGGDSGDGGIGGGGAGGWSIGILLMYGSTGNGPIDISLGAAGMGGSSAGNAGANGRAVAIHNQN